MHVQHHYVRPPQSLLESPVSYHAIINVVDVSCLDANLSWVQVTMKRLQGEKEKRLAEMAKIDTLDEKIPTELAALKDKVRLVSIYVSLACIHTRITELKEHLLSW